MIAEVTAFPIILETESALPVVIWWLAMYQPPRAEEALRRRAPVWSMWSAPAQRSSTLAIHSSRPLNFISSNVNDLLGYRAEDLLADEHLWGTSGASGGSLALQAQPELRG